MTHTNGHGNGHGHGHGHGHGTVMDFAGMAELLDLDGQVFRTYLEEAVALARRATSGAAVHRIADLGCGTGTGTLTLARQFPDAELVAVDAAEPLLEHLADAARGQGVGGRVRTLAADLDQGWPAELHDLDLVWASTSVHHLADPEGALAAVRSALAPGGVLALAEVDDVDAFHPSFLTGLPEPLGGLEARLRSALRPELTAAMPYLGAAWGALLVKAGFTVETDRVFDVEITPPLPAGTGRYAVLALRRLRDQLRDAGHEDGLDHPTLALLDEVTADGPAGVQHRQDLTVRTRRHLWVARAA